MSDARRYAVWPEPRSRSRSLKGSRPSVPHGTNFFLDLVAPPLWFSNAACGCEILSGRGACHLVDTGFRKIRSENTIRQCCTTLPADSLILPPHTIGRYGGERVVDTFSSLRVIKRFFRHYW